MGRGIENVNQHQGADGLVLKMGVHRFAQGILVPLVAVTKMLAGFRNVGHKNGTVHVGSATGNGMHGGSTNIDDGVLALDGNLRANRLNLAIRAMEIISHVVCPPHFRYWSRLLFTPSSA